MSYICVISGMDNQPTNHQTNIMI